MQLGRGFVMDTAPLPLSVSFCLLSLQLCWRDTEAQGSGVTFLGGQQGEKQEGGAGSQDSKPGWCLSVYNQSLLFTQHNAMLW